MRNIYLVLGYSVGNDMKVPQGVWRETGLYPVVAFKTALEAYQYCRHASGERTLYGWIPVHVGTWKTPKARKKAKRCPK